MTEQKIIKMNGQVNRAINSLETITFHKHHYVRKAGLKRLIKDLILEYSGGM